MTDPGAAGKRPSPPRRDRPLPGAPGPGATALSIARSAVLAVALVAAYYLLPLAWHGVDADALVLVGGLLMAGLFFGWEMWLITRSPSPRLKAVEAVAVTVVLYLVLFASGYYVLEHTVPGSFSTHLTRTDALYFTLSTFATVGFGDITPVSQAGRVLAMCQMAGGLLLAGVAVRVLTGAVRVGLRHQGREPPE
ncbi:potassium channel family protein [Streptomyces sp. NBC_00557]|uniref:potassium channel family protein n=1 Tax=Streptomyces sp. NBC_00557 TaxID=2975776 RepID=UPI002E7FDAF4|nr:potassium channel family protein [Streptomyces sp. NBC_00557]WUC33658.1 potassium channel family protein [Streptomyces sp. NBC_00557]